MVSQSKSTLAKIAGEITVTDAFGALTQLVDAVRETVQIHETESTKREKLKTYRETEVRRIKSSEKILREYFDRIFQERRDTSDRLFASLDVALEAGDVSAMQTIVGGIVEVARTSPLAGIGNIAELKRAMEDPDAVFDL
ncbi:hypothetical protein GCM10027414_04790 [Humibacter ginsengiterrae]